MPPVLKKEGDTLTLTLSGCRRSEFQDALEKIKEVPGRRWNPEDKVWVVPATAQNADRILKTIRPDADEELTHWIHEEMSSHEESLTTAIPDDSDSLCIPWAYKRMPWQPERINDEVFRGALPYQRAAIECLAEWQRTILADDMGLGKTFEAISAVEEYQLRNTLADRVTKPEGPKLIVAPASVKGGWRRELTRWLKDPEVELVEGKSSAKKRKAQIEAGLERDAWIIVNWEQLRIESRKVPTRNGGTRTVKSLKEPLFGNTEWLGVIADEAHRAKNRKAKQTQGLWECQGQVMYALTGTPIMNSPDELWALLRWLWPQEYGNSLPPSKANPAGVPKIAYSVFYDEYVDYYEDHFKKKIITGVRNPDALRFVLREKMIRRTAALLGLKGRKRIYVDDMVLNDKQRKLYDEAERAMWLAIEEDVALGNKDAIEFAKTAVEGGSVANLLRIPNGAARLVRLQQILETPALLGGPDDSAALDDFEERFEDSRPEPWVLWCKFKGTCDIAAERLRSKYGANVGVYNGDTSPEERTALEDKFQRGELDVIVATIDAMKEGVTLTRSHLMYFLTRSFVPDINEQCEAREDRLGQQNRVLVYIAHPEETVAVDKVDPINRLKEGIVRAVLPKDEIKEASSV